MTRPPVDDADVPRYWRELGLPGLVDAVTVAVTDALQRVCGGGNVTCRLTHVYPDGAAPYFTVLAPARRGSEVAQWDEVKAAASEADKFIV